MYIIHKSVLATEVIEYLNPRTDHNYIDCTLGAGGHAQSILEAAQPKGRLLGIDTDKEAIEFCQQRLSEYDQRVVLVKDNFINLLEIAKRYNFYPAQGILIDLGVSWHQLATPERGFSFQEAGKLDMRLDQAADLEALTVINDFNKSELIDIFKKFGEVREAAPLADRIIQSRKQKKITTTKEFTEIINSLVPRKNRQEKIKFLSKVFQAVRIQVNDELVNLSRGLEAAVTTLAKNGRLVVISYHSLEDRIVKKFFKERAQGCICPPEFFQCQCDHRADLKILTSKPIIPQESEVKDNPKSRSAKLRAVTKL